MTIKASTITRDERMTLQGAANRTVECFMDYPYDASTYRKIQHIKVIKLMFNTDLRTAKDVVDVAFECWKNENPTDENEVLQALRDKLTGNRNKF